MVHFLGTLWGATVVVLALILISTGGLVTVKKMMSAEDISSLHSVSDPLLQVVGMMFAILLGFMVGDAMQRFAQARVVTQQEAASVADIFRMAEGFPPSDKKKIQSLCVAYCDGVVKDEWPRMAEKKTSNKVWKIYNDLWSTLVKLDVHNDSESAVKQSILPCMVSVGDNRRMRVEAMNNGLHGILWAVLIMAGMSTIVFTFFFDSKNLKLQIAMTAIIGLVLGLNIFLLASYDDPFAGDITVHPDAFIVDEKLFNTVLDKNDPYEQEQQH